MTSIEGLLPSYAIITPVRDEIEHFARTANSLLSQSHPSVRWVVVDDGSTDGTRELAELYAAAHDWITVVGAEADGARARGARIVRAFHAGLATLGERPEIVVKLDADLFLPPHYFAWVAEVFSHDPRAGVVGGVAYVQHRGRWRPDGSLHNVNGVAKSYRSACLEDIDGLSESMGWDGIDEYSARARGWRVHVLTELGILHYRPRGSKQPWHRARWEEGLGMHYMGSLWRWMLVRSVFRMRLEPPPVLGGLALAAGFTYARARALPQIDDPRAKDELRREQRKRFRRLLKGRHSVVLPPLPGGGPALWVTGRLKDERGEGEQRSSGLAPTGRFRGQGAATTVAAEGDYMTRANHGDHGDSTDVHSAARGQDSVHPHP